MFIFSSLKGLQFTFQSFQSDRGGQSGSRYNKYIHLTFSLMIYSPRILEKSMSHRMESADLQAFKTHLSVAPCLVGEYR